MKPARFPLQERYSYFVKFRQDGALYGMYVWALDEKEEYQMLKSLDDDWEWTARDSGGDHGGNLFAYSEKPFKCYDVGEWDCGIGILFVGTHRFQFIQWEDEEPYNIQELIEEYESEETEVKSKQELIEKWESAIESAEFYGKGKEERLISYMKDFVSDLNQLDEPEVLSKEWIDKDTVYADVKGSTEAFLNRDSVKNLLVPKQEEVDQAYKDGYEKGKQHTYHKGYLEGLADKESINPERSPEVDRHKELLDELNDLYARKNQDYGNSFDESLDEDGLLVLKIRLGDKYKRFSTLINQKNEVIDESMRDTLIDLANYALMGVMWMDKNEEEE